MFPVDDLVTLPVVRQRGQVVVRPGPGRFSVILARLPVGHVTIVPPAIVHAASAEARIVPRQLRRFPREFAAAAGTRGRNCNQAYGPLSSVLRAAQAR